MKADMIITFKHKGLEAFYLKGISKGLQQSYTKRLKGILQFLDAAVIISDMDIPGLRLHQLEPKVDNRWSLRLDGNYRVVFRFEAGSAYEIDVVDYH